MRGGGPVGRSGNLAEPGPDPCGPVTAESVSLSSSESNVGTSWRARLPDRLDGFRGRVRSFAFPRDPARAGWRRRQHEHTTIQTTRKPRGSSAEASPSRGSPWRSNSHHSAAVGSGLRHLLRRWPGALHPAGLTQPTTGCRTGSFRDPKVLSGPSRLAAVWSTRSGPGLSRSDPCVPLRRARCRPSPRPKPSSRQTPWRTALRRFPADAPARSSGPARGAEAPRASAKVRPPPGYVNRNRCLVFAW